MSKDEIDEIIEEAVRLANVERAEAAEYDKLSYLEKLARKKGFTNDLEYRNWLAQQRGFVNNAEYKQNWNFKKGKGTGLTMNESKNSAQYLGIFIAERLLPKIFDEPKMMPHGNSGYDAICKNNYKIDVKSSIRKDNHWLFHIRNNKIADAFLCIGFSNRDDLDVKHIWLFPGNEIVRKCPLNELKGLSICDTGYSLSRVAQYELTNKVADANNVCILFKKGDLK